MDVGADGVAIITIINPPVNSLSFDGILLFIPHFPSSHANYHPCMSLR